MDEKQSENGRSIGCVKAAIDKYGGKINQVKKTQKSASNSEIRNSKGQLHIAKKRINQINEDREMAEKKKSQAELELVRAKKLVRELTSEIQVSKAMAKEKMKEFDALNIVAEIEDHQYIEVARQVEAVKRELSKIKLSMARITEEKSLAEKEAEAAGLRIRSYMTSAEQLRAEIEAANEEEVLVELAQIEASKELAAIEAQRKEESEKFSTQIEETRRKINDMREEIEQIKDLEDKLAVTNSDVQVLQQLKLIKEMDTSAESSAKLKSSNLLSVKEDVEAAKKELESIKGGGFQLMTSMDAIRNELKQILEEKDKMKKLEEKTENTVKNMNSKIIKAKDKVEAVSSSEEKAKSMSSSLSLEKLEMEKEATEKESTVTREETASIRAEIKKIETETDSTEEKLQDAMQEVEEVKSAEAKALKKLKSVIENAVRNRATRNKSTITISRFEYDYLTGCAVEAKEMAEKKVVAARGWAEALKDSQRELKLKVAVAERKMEELRLKEEQQILALEKEKKVVEGELKSKRQGNRNLQGRRSMGEYGYPSTPARQTKYRRSVGSPATRRLTRSTSSTMKRRRKVLLKIAKYFAGKQIEDEKGVALEDNSEQASH